LLEPGVLSQSLELVNWNFGRMRRLTFPREKPSDFPAAFPPAFYPAPRKEGRFVVSHQRALVAAFSEVAFTIFPALVYLVLTITEMVRLDARLALVVVVFAPIAPLIGARGGPRSSRASAR
jgi:hypothetical protein